MLNLATSLTLHWHARLTTDCIYKVAVLTYKAFHGSMPRYLGGWALWFQSPIYKADGHCVLPAPVALWCLPSGSLLSPGFPGCCSTRLERPARRDDVSSVVDVIPSASQDMALQTIVSRSHHLICPLQTV